MNLDILAIVAVIAGLLALATLGAWAMSSLFRLLHRLHPGAWVLVPLAFAIVLYFTL